jgi:hypothetical protein
MISANEPRLALILKLSRISDFYVEAAEDYLHDHGISYSTHNSDSLIELAYSKGWRPW